MGYHCLSLAVHNCFDTGQPLVDRVGSAGTAVVPVVVAAVSTAPVVYTDPVVAVGTAAVAAVAAVVVDADEMQIRGMPPPTFNGVVEAMCFGEDVPVAD